MHNEVTKKLDFCANLGRLLLENGAETYRVEDTVYRVAVHYGFRNAHVFVVPNTIIFTVEAADGEEHTRLMRVFKRDTNLGKVRDGNALSRKITGEDLSVDEAKARLEAIFAFDNHYSLLTKTTVAGISCGFFAFIFWGNWSDWAASILVGALGYFIYDRISQAVNVQFFSEMTASFVIGWLAVLATLFIPSSNINIIIIAAIMPLVPGRAITNGIRDLMASDYVSGISVLADALLTATAIGIGVAAVLASI